MRTRKGITGLTGLLAATALVAAACGSDDEVTGGPEGSAGTTVTSDGGIAPPGTGSAGPTTTVPAAGAGGWLGGEPEWHAEPLASVAESDGDLAYSAEPGLATDAPAAASERESAGGDAVAPGEPLPPDVEPPVVNDQPLRAGSVDDNADYAGFLDYLVRIRSLGIELRDLDPANRSIVTVTDAAGGPAASVDVVATSGDVAVPMRTTADGTVRFHPGFYGIAADAEITFSVDGAEATVTAGQDVSLVTVTPGLTADAAVPLDVLFLLDATGSMSDEIDRLKATIDLVAARVAALDPAPDVRFAMTLYRDEGDAFVTATHDFTGDVQEFRAALADVVATGGGDFPEALDEGLAEALSAPAWRDPASAVQLVFVVADAPPQISRQVQTPYSDSVREAIERGVKIFPVASSNSDDQAEAVFRQMAQATGAPFVFLSYGAGGAATGGSTDIQTTDYEELALDELVVRLIAEELSDLTGGGAVVTVPPTIAPTTTNPEGQ